MASDSSDRPDSERILEDIDDTRNEIDETLDALQRRLQPDQILEPVLSLVTRSVERSPVGSLLGAVAMGVVAGRLVARRRQRRIEHAWAASTPLRVPVPD